MKKNIMRLLALVLVVAMVACLFAGCKPATDDTGEVPAGTTPTGNTDNQTPESNDTLVVATADFSAKFSPFFATTAYDIYIGSDMTQLGLLAIDREGNVVQKGIEGETRNFNGTDYLYTGAGDVEIVENADGTVDYNITMRDDIKFSDGTPATIDDVIFSMYVLSDPTYDGSSTFYSLPIAGMKEYRSGMDSRGNVIFAAGEEGYTENALYTEEQYNTFWDYYHNQAGADFAQEIVDYCLAKYAGYGAVDVTSSAALWGFELEDGATVADFWAAIVEAYEGDIETAESVETAGSTLQQLTVAGLGAEFQAGVETGESAATITGIEKTGDYSLTLHMTEVDATAIYSIGVAICPLHYYGDASLYDYENNSFGFVKGDLSIAKSKISEPMGAGPYKFVSYENATVTMEANENYFKGEPKIKYILFKETNSADMLTGINTGTYDLTADASYNRDNHDIIAGYNSNGEVVGDVYTTVSVDNLGYGYIGINADLVKIGDDRGSDASKNLRKAFATLFAAYRDEVIDSYYGELATVINYPISNTSWAAPKPADEGYEVAFSKDVNGNDIFTDDMDDAAKYEAALQAALGYFEAAGYTVTDGKITAAPEGAATEFTVTIPADGTGDHPAYKILTGASEQLAEVGITLTVNDVSDGNILWDGLDANTIEMWAAAWGAAVDPDMYQVYHSDNVSGQGTGSNHYYITSAELDQLIMDARSSTDQSYRKAAYKDCLDIILDWATEIPTYQRQNAVLVSTQRVNTSTLTPDITPFWGWMNDIELLELN